MQKREQDEIDEIFSTIAGIPALNGKSDDLKKRERRFLMQGSLERVVRGTAGRPYHVYLFNDLLLYTEICTLKKKGKFNKFIAFKSLKDILFIDMADTKAMRYAFEILHTDEKKRWNFVCKNLEQKSAWKQNIEAQCNRLAEENNEQRGMSTPPRDTRSFAWTIDDEHPSPKTGTIRGHLGSNLSSTSNSPLFDPELMFNSNSPSPSLAPMSLSATDSPLSDSSMSAIRDSWSADDEFVDDADELKTEDVADTGEAIMCVSDEGVPFIKAAPVNTIAWLLVYGDSTDITLARAFLFAYRNFSSPKDLFQNLMLIYHMEGPMPRDLPIKYSKEETKVRAANFIHIWVEHYFKDFMQRELYSALLEFMKTASKENKDMEQKINKIKLAILRVNALKIRKFVGRRRGWFLIHEHSGVKLSPARGPSSPMALNSRSGIMELRLGDNVTIIAEQMCLAALKTYVGIGLGELHQMEWKSQRARRTAVNVLHAIDRFNAVSHWVSNEIVSLTTAKLRATAIERYVALAQKLVEFRNFDSMMAVLSGVNHQVVSRLKKSWQLVNSSSISGLEELNILMDSQKNFRNYREALKRCEPPCVPYVGIFLRDITFLEEGNQDKISDLVNFEKIQMYGKLFKEVMSFQRGKYPFPDDEGVQMLMRKLTVISEDQLYRISQAAEPIATIAS